MQQSPLNTEEKIPFFKYSGCGNDFIIIDHRRQIIPTPKALDIPLLCNRHWGIGADGVIFLALSPVADFRMEYYNSDNTKAALCGNGLRSVASFLLRLGFPKRTYRIQTEDCILKIHYRDELLITEMPPPERCQWSIPIAADPYSFTAHFVHTGVPHLVLFVKEDLAHFPLDSIGPLLRHHPRFAPAGTNVTLTQIEEGFLRYRTYERGVETETKACGTGAAAAAIAAAQIYGIPSPIQMHTLARDCLTIHFKKEGESYHSLEQEGSICFLYEGIFPLHYYTERDSKMGF